MTQTSPAWDEVGRGRESRGARADWWRWSEFSNVGRAGVPAGEEALTADWVKVVMTHLEVDPGELRRHVPFPVETWEGRAWVSLVTFTLERMAPVWGGRLGRLLFRPIATHEFLNVRTYVRVGGEPGIYFLAEWLASRIAVKLGPPVYGLPYRLGRMEYHHEPRGGSIGGSVEDAVTGAKLAYRAGFPEGRDLSTCTAGTLDAWLMERYAAFTFCRGKRRCFRVGHEPWRWMPIHAEIGDRSLLTENWPWMEGAPVVGSVWSPGLFGVAMGRPRCVAGFQ